MSETGNYLSGSPVKLELRAQDPEPDNIVS